MSIFMFYYPWQCWIRSWVRVNSHFSLIDYLLKLTSGVMLGWGVHQYDHHTAEPSRLAGDNPSPRRNPTYAVLASLHLFPGFPVLPAIPERSWGDRRPLNRNPLQRCPPALDLLSVVAASRSYTIFHRHQSSRREIHRPSAPDAKLMNRTQGNHSQQWHSGWQGWWH